MRHTCIGVWRSRLEVLEVVAINITIFCDVTSCILIDCYQRFWDTCYFHLQGRIESREWKNGTGVEREKTGRGTVNYSSWIRDTLLSRKWWQDVRYIGNHLPECTASHPSRQKSPTIMRGPTDPVTFPFPFLSLVVEQSDSAAGQGKGFNSAWHQDPFLGLTQRPVHWALGARIPETNAVKTWSWTLTFT
jgi:hypothetical protein